MRNLKKIFKIAPLLMCAYASSAGALVINFNHAANMDARALAGFQSAADRWSSILLDNVQVNLDIGFSTLGAGILGSTGSTRGTIGYGIYRDYLAADATSTTDLIATSHMSQNACLKVYINGTGNNPNGIGSATPYVDNNCNANNNVVRLTLANARAVGLFAAVDTTVDGAVSFSDTFTWDFDPSDGINSDAYDFIGVATHEIGHALGFVSGVDLLDGNRAGNFSDTNFLPSPADLFRCSTNSKAAGTDLDMSADNRTKYFSLDNCDTTLATFSTGRLFGDGQQASHWKDNMHIGILDPTAARGELLSISSLDKQMYDAIGWDVPEPGTLALFFAGLAGLFGLHRRYA